MKEHYIPSSEEVKKAEEMSQDTENEIEKEKIEKCIALDEVLTKKEKELSELYKEVEKLQTELKDLVVYDLTEYKDVETLRSLKGKIKLYEHFDSTEESKKAWEEKGLKRLYHGNDREYWVETEEYKK